MARRFELGVPVLEQMMPALREGMGISVGHAYQLQEGSDGLQTEYVGYWGVADPERAARRVRRLLSGRRRWGLFDPRSPEPRQRNAVLAIRWEEWSGSSPAQVAARMTPALRRFGVRPRLARSIAEELVTVREGIFWPLGLFEHHQVRALVCDGESLLAWVGGFHPEELTNQQLAILRAVVPVLRERLLLERQVREAPSHRAALAAALEAIPAAAMVIGRGGRVAHANRVGRELLERDGRAVLEEIHAAIRGGGDGYVVSSIPTGASGSMHLAVRRTREADRLHRRADAAAAAWHLTARQSQVLRLVAEGHTNRRIAAQLGCSMRTVEVHVTAILDKAGCESRAALVARVWRAGAV